MGDLIGIGLSHYPPLSGLDEDMSGILRWTLDDPDIPIDRKDPRNWPEPMRREWGDDGGKTSAGEHRRALIAGFDRLRAALDEFSPDAVVIWGDDQYENFREDVIPPFCVLAYEDHEVRPWASAQHSSDMEGRPNVWAEPREASLTVRGHREVALHLVSSLLAQGIDVAYAYQPLHHEGFAHAFLNTVLYLDYHRRGFPYPVVAFPVNCYGRRVVSFRGFLSRFADRKPFDPPSPSPGRLMELGAATARALRDTDWRVALIASSSWSHAFLCDKTWRLHPDMDSDRRLFAALERGDCAAWQKVTVDELEDAGQQELLNWFALVGAMDELGVGPTWATMVESYIFNSNKVFALFEPGRATRGQ
jgi:hypothetical protein